MELEEYLDVCKKAWEIMKEKEKEYGDSWKYCKIVFLEERMDGEVKEVIEAETKEEKAKENLDVINLAVMNYKRNTIYYPILGFEKPVGY